MFSLRVNHKSQQFSDFESLERELRENQRGKHVSVGFVKKSGIQAVKFVSVSDDGASITNTYDNAVFNEKSVV